MSFLNYAGFMLGAMIALFATISVGLSATSGDTSSAIVCGIVALVAAVVALKCWDNEFGKKPE